MDHIFKVIAPSNKKIPIIISSPHSGTEIPEDLSQYMAPEALSSSDSDTLIHELYSFAAPMGMTQLYAKFSRYVVDLNRPENEASLYNDGRSETELIPTKTFAGTAIYPEYKVSNIDKENRIKKFYKPYHAQLKQLIEQTQKEFGRVLLFEAHSITRYVPTINKNKFPDLIVGTLDGKTCHPIIEEIVAKTLRQSGFDTSLNQPFKGGYITRNYADPANGVHTIQLEMSKDIYMNTNESEIDPEKSVVIRQALKNTFENIIKKFLEI